MAYPLPTRADFLVAYPQFNAIASARATLLDLKIAEAARSTSERVYQNAAVWQDAVFLRAAVLLCATPAGAEMRNSNPEAVAYWEFRLSQMKGTATMGVRVFVL